MCYHPPEDNINVVLPQMIAPENVRGNVIIRTDASIQPDDNVRYHSGGSMKLNACFLFLAHMVYL